MNSLTTLTDKPTLGEVRSGPAFTTAGASSESSENESSSSESESSSSEDEAARTRTSKVTLGTIMKSPNVG